MWGNWNPPALQADTYDGAAAVTNSLAVTTRLGNSILLGIHAREWKHTSTRTCTQMFIAALLTTAKRWKQHKHLPADEWKRNWYVHALEYQPAVKGSKVLTLLPRGGNMKMS